VLVDLGFPDIDGLIAALDAGADARRMASGPQGDIHLTDEAALPC